MVTLIDVTPPASEPRYCERCRGGPGLRDAALQTYSNQRIPRFISGHMTTRDAVTLVAAVALRFTV